MSRNTNDNTNIRHGGRPQRRRGGNPCRIQNCRSTNHTTAGHRCRNCNRYGHDLYECGYGDRIAQLREISKHDKIRDKCDVINCRYKHTHSTRHHFCKMCNKLYPQCECTGSLTNSYIDNLRQDMERHTDELQQLLDDHGVDLEDEKEMVILTASAPRRRLSQPTSYKHVKCPVCRAVNTIMSLDKCITYGLTQLCPICQEKEINVRLPDCFHACLCTDCLKKMDDDE
jgi:hypothetical protein